MTAHKIFLSYRRDDEPQATARLSERLRAIFGQDRVFKDDDNIPAGAPFPARIKTALKQSAVLIAVIGEDWLDAKDDDGERRVDDRDDWVRTEIALAIERGLLVIPVIIPPGELPRADELPPELQKLPSNQRATLRAAKQEFDADVRWLIECIEAHLIKVDPSYVAKAQANNSAGIPRDYIERLRKESARIDILGSDANEAVPDSLPQIYVPAITLADRSEEPEERNLREDNVELVLNRLGDDSLLLSGDPGSGKTTFCQWATHITLNNSIPAAAVPPPEGLQETLPEGWSGRLPLWIRLRDFWRGVDLPTKKDTLTQNQFNAAIDAWLDSDDSPGLTSACFREQMAQGQMLLLIDGVDEVPEEDGSGQELTYPRAALLAGLAHALPGWRKAGNRAMVTSRPYGLTAQQRTRLELPEAKLAALTRPLQALFVQRWYRAIDPEQGDELAEGLIGEIGTRDALRDLRENPLLLTALCVMYREGKRLPQDVYQLYDSVVDRVLYNRYRGSDGERERVRWRLEAVALGMHYGYGNQAPRRAPLASVPRDELDRILGDYIERSPATEGQACEVQDRRKELLERSGLLLMRADNSAQFYHQDFRDFLAAERWLRAGNTLQSALQAHADQRGWRRMLGFLFAKSIAERGGVDGPLGDLQSITPDGAKDIDATPAVRALVIADCLEIAAGKADKCGLGDRWQRRLFQLCQSSLSNGADAAARNELFLALGRLGWDTRRGVGLDDAGLPDIEWLPVPSTGEAEFYISRYLITNAQFKAFADDDYDNPRWWQDIEEKKTPVAPSTWTEPNAPRTDVTWYQAVAFARWLSANGALPRANWTVVLPSDREWRVSYTGTEKKTHPWGARTDSDAHTNTRESGLRRTSCVGVFPKGASDAGADDMAGNVWEWCADKYNEPGQCGVDASVDERVLRGGSWHGSSDFLRSSDHSWSYPEDHYYVAGFRVLCRPHH